MSDYDNEIFDWAREDKPRKMTQQKEFTKEQEDQITLLMAQTFHFVPISKSGSFKCKLCGKRLMGHYSGMPMNERMINHWQINHSTIYPNNITWHGGME